MSERNNGRPPSASTDGPSCPGQPLLQRIATRESRIGEGFTIRRAIPSRQRRMVGAWCFLDQAGPLRHAAGEGLHVGPHPHIGLQTFTWMVEGEIMHRDSLGCEQIIRPGQVNLMTAGSGISHAEDAVNDDAGALHAAQLWIALPDAERHRAPSFHHYPELPIVDDGGFRCTVLAGEALGTRAPAEVFTPLMGLDCAASGAARSTLPLNPAFEHADLPLQGRVNVAGENIEVGTLHYLGSARSALAVQCDQPARLLLIGGEPFDERVLLWWNFVARSRDEIAAASEAWNAGRHFGEVRGSPSPRIPAPPLNGLSLKTPAR